MPSASAATNAEALGDPACWQPHPQHGAATDSAIGLLAGVAYFLLALGIAIAFVVPLTLWRWRYALVAIMYCIWFASGRIKHVVAMRGEIAYFFRRLGRHTAHTSPARHERQKTPTASSAVAPNEVV